MNITDIEESPNFITIYQGNTFTPVRRDHFAKWIELHFPVVYMKCLKEKLKYAKNGLPIGVEKRFSYELMPIVYYVKYRQMFCEEWVSRG